MIYSHQQITTNYQVCNAMPCDYVPWDIDITGRCVEADGQALKLGS